MISMKTMVTGKNQISIPAEIARTCGIEPGWKVEWRLGRVPGELVLRLIPDRMTIARRLHGAGKRWIRHGRDPVAELVAERESEG
ncbi:AbrB/MazE/SpoVT family DNA-binding domain-containing protein [Myxococcota bacterium]|nr:AbrB/MazE/SpoVT family DNA-binding domain-containing protein [Myxococcota bacterium]